MGIGVIFKSTSSKNSIEHDTSSIGMRLKPKAYVSGVSLRFLIAGARKNSIENVISSIGLRPEPKANVSRSLVNNKHPDIKEPITPIHPPVLLP